MRRPFRRTERRQRDLYSGLVGTRDLVSGAALRAHPSGTSRRMRFSESLAQTLCAVSFDRSDTTLVQLMRRPQDYVDEHVFLSGATQSRKV